MCNLHKYTKPKRLKANENVSLRECIKDE